MQPKGKTIHNTKKLTQQLGIPLQHMNTGIYTVICMYDNCVNYFKGLGAFLPHKK